VTLRRQGAMGKRETRTQEALVAALRARPRTPYPAAQCVLVAKASIFSSLLAVRRHLSRDSNPLWVAVYNHVWPAQPSDEGAVEAPGKVDGK
jgi:hypothetical protein